MKVSSLYLILSLILGTAACTRNTEKSPAPIEPAPVVVLTKPEAPKEKIVEVFAKYFEQADAIHREAWWVLTEMRPPVSKSPFGKVQRALLSSMDIKLSNKSLFRCDRYVVKRDVLGVSGFPQKAEIFEKCSEKVAAKKIAEFFAPRASEIQVTFFPDGLEEILGLGATVLNRSILCTLIGNEKEQLQSLKCKDWAQDRTKEQMIRLDVYDYERAGKNLIKLRGKVYENLSDIRKIEADVPLEGKVNVIETELYPPEPVVTPSPSPVATPKVVGAPAENKAENKSAVPPATPDQYSEGADLGIPGPRLDPDVLIMQQNQLLQEQQQHIEQGLEYIPQEEPYGR